MVYFFGGWRAFLADTNAFAFSINWSAANLSLAEVEKDNIRDNNTKVHFSTELSLYT